MKDICLNCGKEYKSKIWGAKCDCNSPNVTHQKQCNGCNNVIGIIISDDYCGAEKLYCPDCLDKCRTN